MTTRELLNLDWRDSDNRKTLYKALQLIPPLAKYNPSEIELKHVQRAIHIMCNKYEMFLRIFQDPKSGDGYDIWSCCIVDNTNLKELAKVYGVCLDEIFIKSAIVLYVQVRKIKKGVKT